MRIVVLFLLVLCLTACSRKLQQATFVLLPDTQTYAEKFPEVLESQVAYLLKEGKGIHMVLQQGDLTQNNNEAEWEVVKKAFAKLDGKVPYAILPGNHDMGSVAGKFADVRNTTLYNQYFPVSHMSTLPHWSSAFENKMDNTWYTFNTGRKAWLVLNLEFGPRDTVLQWANKVIALHPDRLVIINTHAYMYSDSTRQNAKDYWRPQGYGIGKDVGGQSVNDGEEIWDKLVKKHPNIRFVFSGHVLNGGVGTLVSINDGGYPVYQMLANYQEGVKGSVKGGNGWLRLLKMDFKKGTLTVQTYSPYINQYMTDPAHQFVIKEVVYKTGTGK
jgi:hypothetical protein